MSRYDRYSETALGVLVKTQDIALRQSSPETGSHELATALLLSALPDIVAIARSNNVVVDDERLKSLNARIESEPPLVHAGAVKISSEFRTILDKAEALAGEAKVEPAHLIQAAWPVIKDDLAPYFKTEIAPDLSLESSDISLPEINTMGQNLEAHQVLSRFGRELTAPESDFAIFGREQELDSLTSTMLKYWKPNPLIIGESGVGKTALVEGLAMRIKSGKVPDALKACRIFEIRIAEVLAGTNLHGALEENLNQLLHAAASMPNAILFIDEIHQIVPAFANNPISEVLKPALSDGRIRCIGATTNTDYSRYLEKDSALLRRFQTILLKEPDEETVRTILGGLAPKLEAHFSISIPHYLLEKALDTSRRYLPMRKFPDKALDVLDRALSRAAFRGEKTLTEERLADAVHDIANVVADTKLDLDQGMPGLESALRSDILGQEQAISTLAEAIRVSKMRLDNDDGRPDGAFLFTGPTGVGKTALAISLARALSGREDALFRIDMSEFSDAHTAARLLGAPPGYIGYDDAPLLARAVDTCAGGVLLLDEMEKAHPQVHRLFLQILDAGRATDSTGRVLSFASITIIATCNVGTGDGPPLGFGSGTALSDGKIPLAALKRAFPIELLNRFDSIVPFRALSRENCEAILRDIIFTKSNRNLARTHGISLSIGQSVLDDILTEGFSHEFGARHLQRIYREMVLVPLAHEMAALRGKNEVLLERVSGKTIFTLSKGSIQ